MEGDTQPEVTAYLGLGTNLGDRKANLEEAVRRLSDVGSVGRKSEIVETEPWGYTDQPRFLNMVVALETSVPPRELLSALKRIETEMGRRPTFRNGPRLIDMDLLLYGEESIDTPVLVVPHPRMAERPFVMGPLAQIAPDVAARYEKR